MPDMQKLDEALPEGISADQVLDALKEAGYKVEPSEAEGDEEEPAGVMIGVAMGEDKPKDGESEEGAEGDEEEEETPFMQADQGERLKRTKGFLDEYNK